MSELTVLEMLAAEVKAAQMAALDRGYPLMNCHSQIVLHLPNTTGGDSPNSIGTSITVPLTKVSLVADDENKVIILRFECDVSANPVASTAVPPFVPPTTTDTEDIPG